MWAEKDNSGERQSDREQYAQPIQQREPSGRLIFIYG
jgi:hypothetical protein